MEIRGISEHRSSVHLPQPQLVHFAVIALRSQTQRKPEVDTRNSQFITVTFLVVLNTSPQKSLWKDHLASLSLPGPDSIPLFVQAEASLGLPTKRTTKPSPMKHQQELHTQESQIQYLIFYGARNKLPKQKKRNPSSGGMASSRIKSGLSVTQLVHLVCGVKGVDSSLFQATHLFVLPISQAV